MKTPFKLKYNVSPLKNKLNSPLKQGLGGRWAANTWPGAAGYHGETTDIKSKSYYTVECDGENCPTPNLDKDPETSVY